MNQPKYPEIKIKLVGEDGNAYSILGRCTQAMRTAGLSKAEQKAFMDEATASDYDHLLATAMEWFDTN